MYVRWRRESARFLHMRSMPAPRSLSVAGVVIVLLVACVEVQGVRRLQSTRPPRPPPGSQLQPTPTPTPPPPADRPPRSPPSPPPARESGGVSTLMEQYDADRSGALEAEELAELVQAGGAPGQDGGASPLYLPKPAEGLPGATIGFLQTPGGYPTGPDAVESPWVAEDDWTSHPLPVAFSVLWAGVVAVFLAQAARKAGQSEGEIKGGEEQLSALSKADVQLALILAGFFGLMMCAVADYYYSTRTMSFYLLDAQFLCLWACALGAVLITVGRRIVAAPAVPVQTDHIANALGNDMEDGGKSSAETQMRALGYRTAPVGTAASKAMALGCALWLGVAFIVLLDYYDGCQFTGVDNLCFYGDYLIFGGWTTNSELLFQSWWLMLLWFLPLIALRNQIGTFFKDRCQLCEAEFVWVWVPDQTEGTKNVLSPGAVVLMVRRLRELYGRFSSTTGGHDGTVAVQANSQGRKFFVFECTRYMIIPGSDQFEKSTVTCGTTYSQIHATSNGLSAAAHGDLLDQAGENVIPFVVATWGEAAASEFLSMFYLYQFLIYYVWFWFSYLTVASLLGGVVIGSGVLNIHIERKNQRTIAQLTAYSTECTVIRDGIETVCDSSQLVPGDICIIRGDSWTLPADLCLISGSAVCDESGLTGESMPVRKVALPAPEGDHDPQYDPEHRDAKHTLFAGTKVLQAGTGSDRVMAVVTATGIATSKGQLVSSILYPGIMRFKYDEELPAVMLILGVMCAIIFKAAGYLQALSGQPKTGITAWAYGIFTISQTLSPLLPLALVVGQTVSANRLQEIGVRCINPKRIAISAKIRVYCFDKTGTLTKDGLDFLGAQPIVKRLASKGGSEPCYGEFTNLLLPANKGRTVADAMKTDGADPLFLLGLASCHALTILTESKMLVGNQVEVKMFSSTMFELIEEPGSAPVVRSNSGAALRLNKRFEFDHSTMTMSVIVTDEQSGESFAFCKGAPERLVERCEQESVPADYHSVQAAHATAGCYVLAMGVRRLGRVSASAIAEMGRHDVEVGLSLLGLVMFRNELKDDSRDAILDLKKGDVRPVMITGDNAQCGIYIAKESGMLPEGCSVAFGDLDERGEVAWSIVDGEAALTDSDRAIIEDAGGSRTGSLTTAQALQLSSELAVTGKAFAVLENMRFEGPGVKDGPTTYAELLLLKIRIYARISPTAKEQIVRMHIAKGLIVGMCGDGGNDCGALRAAHVGVALSEAEASVVSPFTAGTKSVRSVVDLLREGRCALATSFAGYKFLITYGQIFPVVKLWCFYYGVIMPMADYLMVDVVIVTTISWALTRAEPLDQLGKYRPTSSLLGPTTVASAAGLTILNTGVIYIALSKMASHPAYLKFPAGLSQGAAWWTLGDTWESTTLFACFSFQFVTSALNFGLGSKYRKPLTTNVALLAAVGVLYVFFSYLLLAEPGTIVALFHITSIEYNSLGTQSPVWVNYQAACGACLNSTQCWAYPVGQDHNEHVCGTAREIIDATLYADTRVICGSDPTDPCAPTIGEDGVVSVDPNCCTSGGMPYDFRWQLWLIIVCNCVLAFAFESLCVQGPLRDLLRRQFPAPSAREQLKL